MAEPTSWMRSPGWAAAALVFAVVALVTLPVAPRVWFAILPHLQPHVTLWYVGAGALAAAGLGAWAGRGPRRGQALRALAALLSLYVLLLFVYYRGEAPAKKFHLLEYGLLSGVTLQAVRVAPGERRGLAAAAVFLFVVGTIDEVSQAFIPMRTFRAMDLLANYVGSAMGTVSWLAASPRSPWRTRPPTPDPTP